LLILQLS